MDKVLGIIAEYNPFHNGHLYHLQQSKKALNISHSIAIISGNFTQRGSVSIINKWTKAEMALKNGIDLVIELPLLYSISSAENFAEGAIKILNSINLVDYISFGSECGDINKLTDIANILYNEPKEYKNLLSIELRKGLSFPKARELALNKYLKTDNISNLLGSSNNILGIEYIKALRKYKSNIVPFTLQRFNTNYNDFNINNNIASSTAIRQFLKNEDFDSISKVLPPDVVEIILDKFNSGEVLTDLSIFEKEIIYTLRKMSIKEISMLPDVTEGLEYSIKNAVNQCNNISSLIEQIKSKRYTYTRLQRILIYCLLGITKDDMNLAKNTIPFIRVLGFNANGKKLLSSISKNNPNLHIITSVKKFMDSCVDDNLKLILKKDILASNIYTLGYNSSSPANLDYTHKLIIT